MKRLRHIITFALLQTATAMAQTTVPPRSCADEAVIAPGILSDAHRSLWRAASLTQPLDDAGLFRATSIGLRVCADSMPLLANWREPSNDAQVRLLPLQAAEVSNSAYPRTENDGAAWLGVGVNAGVTAGLEANWRFLHARVAPEAYYQQNKSFAFVENQVPGFSIYNNPYQIYIDYPSRFGPDPFSTLSPGQSYVRADLGNLALAFSTENLWIGAADIYPLLMSNTAPGFPHVRIGTQRPLHVPLFKLDFQLLFASLSESKYFDFQPSNDKHYFTAAMLVIQPDFLSGFSLGIVRAYHDTATATGHGPGFYLHRLYESPFGGQGNSVGNGIGVLMGRWVLAESHFEAYAEWGREDTPGSWLDLLREPDWTQAYVLGFQKTYPSARRLTRFYGELVHLGESAPTRSGRGTFSYYTHSAVIQGHANDGQILGAAIGPGSDAQLLGVDIFTGTARNAFRLQRTRYDDDTYYRVFARQYGLARHDAEITASATHSMLKGPLELEAGLALSRRYGRQFVPLKSGGPDLVETNLSTHLAISWRPRVR